MAEKLDPKELVTFKELLMANSIQVDAIAQLLIEKDIITKEEFFAKLKQASDNHYQKETNYAKIKPLRNTIAREDQRYGSDRKDCAGFDIHFLFRLCRGKHSDNSSPE